MTVVIKFWIKNLFRYENSSFQKIVVLDFRTYLFWLPKTVNKLRIGLQVSAKKDCVIHFKFSWNKLKKSLIPSQNWKFFNLSIKDLLNILLKLWITQK